MTISGGPSNPTHQLADDVAINNGATVERQVLCQGFNRALVRVKCSKIHTIVFKGNGDPGSSDYATLYLPTLATAQVSNQSASATGFIYPIDVSGLGVLDVFVANVDATPGTVSIWVTLDS